MQAKQPNSSKRSVTAPNIPRRNHTPLTNEEGAKSLVKVNPYKIARATSFNVFMEYGAALADTGLDQNQVAKTSPINAPKSSPQLGSKETQNLTQTEELLTTEAAQAQVNLHSVYEGVIGVKDQYLGHSSELLGPKEIKRGKSEVHDSNSDHTPNTGKILSLKEASEVNRETKKVYDSELGIGLNRPQVEPETTLEKKKRKTRQGYPNLGGDQSSASLLNSKSEFDPNFHFDQAEKLGEKRDATVIYTRKPDIVTTQGIDQGLDLADHESVHSPLSESTNRTRTGVKSKFGSDLISLSLTGQDVIESAESLSKKSPALKNFERSPGNYELANEKRGNHVPIKKLKGLPSSRWVATTLISVSVLVGVLLVGLLIAIYILSGGTRDSVNSYFNEGKNIPHLTELVAKYLLQDEHFGTLANSVDGLSRAAKSDNEVTDLMKGVSNVMFHGIAYSPKNAMEPYCGFSKRDAMLDLAKLSTVTTRIRTYGMQCDQAELILEAIDHMNLNMTVAMGVWIGKNDTINRQQMDMMKKVIAKHPDPARVINSIFIGNEVLSREDKSKSELIEYIQEAKRFLKIMKIDDIPVGTSEIGSLIDLELLRNCDVVGANIQPFFGGVSVEDATHWVLRFLDLQILPHNENVGTPIVITEVGWPSGGGRYRYAQAGMASLRIFLSTFLCTMRELPIEYYFFEAYDEPWKEIFWTSNQKWETQWGVFNADRLSKFPLQNIGCI